MADLVQIARLDDQMSAGANAAAAAMNKLADASDKVDTSVNKIGPTASSTVNKFDAITAASNKLTKALADQEARTKSLNDALAAGKITEEQFNGALDGMAARVAAAKRALDTLKNPLDETGNSSKKLQFAMRDLGLQSIDLFQGLATGQPILTTLIQQGSQVVQVNAAMGVGFRQTATAIGGMIARLATNPLVLWGGAIAAVIGTTVAWIAANESAEKHLLSMQASLRATRSDWQSMGETATAAAKAVALSSSLSGADARGAAGVIAGAQNFHGTQQDLESLIKTAGDLAIVMGQKVPVAAKALAEALDDPAKVAKTLAEANFPGMTNAIADTIRRMEDMGQGAEATRLALDTIKQAVDDAREQSMTPLEQALDAIKKKFEQIGEAAVSGLNKAIAKLKELNDAAPKPGALPNLSAFGGPNFNDLLGPNARGRTVLPDVNVTAEGPLPIPPIPPLGGANSVSINRAIGQADTAFNSSKLGQIQHYNDLIKGAQKALHDLADQGVTTGDAVDRLNRGIQANQKSLEDATKKTQTHVSALQKQGDTIVAQIQAQKDLTDAYLKGGDAVQQVLAKQTAEKQLISDGLIPGTQKYTDALAKRTAQQLELNKATAEAQTAKDLEKQKDQLGLLKAETDSLGMNNDARDQMLAKLQAEQQLKEQNRDTTSELSQSYIENARAIAQANDALQHQQQAMRDLQGIAQSVFEQVGNAITNAFVSGSGAAVNFGNVVKGILASLLQQFIKFALLNPLENAFTGSNNTTLGGLVGAATGSGSSGGSGIFGQAQQLFGLAGIGDKLGLTNIQGSISNFLGLNDFSISGLLNGGLFGTSTAETLSGTGASSLAGLGADAGSFGSLSAPTGAFGGASLGSIAGGVGAGFGIGSLAGTGLQSLLHKTGPGPLIGAGLGALGGAAAGAALGSVVPVVGTIIGGLIGGLFGGAIGPHPKSPYSATQVIIDPNGALATGGSASQLVSSNLQQTHDDVMAIDNAMAQLGIHINDLRLPAGKGLIVGQSNVPGGGAIAGADLASIFSQFGFTSTDNNAQLNSRLNGRSFGSLQELGDTVSTFRAQLKAAQDFLAQVPALITGGQNAGSLNQALTQIDANYNPSIQAAQQLLSYQVTGAEQTKQLADAENQLIQVRDRAKQAATDAAVQQTNAMDNGLTARGLTAGAAISGDLGQVKNAALYSFDIQAQAQRQQFSDQLTSIWGDAFKSTQGFADQMALLEQTLGQERLATAKQFDDQIVAQQKAAAAAVHQLNLTNAGVAANIDQAAAALQTDPNVAKFYALSAFDAQASAQRVQFSDQLLQAFGDAYGQTQGYVNEMALLEQQLGLQRLAVAKQYDDAIAQQAQQAATAAEQAAAQAAAQQQQLMDQATQTGTGIITNLAQYAASLQTGAASPLSPRDQYALASSQFNAVAGAAVAGDANSLQQLTGYANTFLGASQNVNGSGGAYVSDFNQVIDILRQVSQIAPDTLTASIYSAETRTQTATLSDRLDDLRASVDALGAKMAQVAATPARIAA
jgi:hypothetical protein